MTAPSSTLPAEPARTDSPPVLPVPAWLLAQITTRLAADRSLWEPQVRFDADRRWYRRLVQEPGWEAWLLTWLPGQSTSLHDHGVSAGAFTVLDGVLTETTPIADHAAPGERIDWRSTAIGPGAVRSFGTGFIHNVANRGDAPAISLHVYGPVLERMTRYALDRQGQLQETVTEQAGVDW